jgi:hypothetical protein
MIRTQRLVAVALVLAAVATQTARGQTASVDGSAAAARAQLIASCDDLRKNNIYGNDTERLINDCKARFAALSDEGALRLNIHNLSMKLAAGARKELHDYVRKCMPRGDCDEEYEHGLAEDIVKYEMDIRTYGGGD